MADQEYTTKIKIEADTKGGEEAAKSFEKAGVKAKSFSGAVGGVTRAMELMNRVLAGFGTIAVFTGLLSKIDSLYRKLDEAVTKSQELRDRLEKEADTKAIENMASAYDKLKKSIDDATTARQRANELEDMERGSAREFEDINAQAAKDAELAALNPNDRYYEQKKAQIEAKYSSEAANRAANRKVEDAETAAARTMAEADAKAGDAEVRRAALVGDRQQLDVLKERLREALAGSVSQNALDANRISEVALVNLLRIGGFQGGWSRLGDERTEEGDKLRNANEEKAKALEAEIKKKEKDIAEKEAEIAELEKEASFLSQKSVIQAGMAENAKDAASATRTAGYRSETAAAEALSGQFAAETDAVRAKALLEAEKMRIEQQIAAQNQRVADAGADVWMAQGAVSEATANGNRAGAAAASRQLASAQSAAQSVEFEAGRLITSLEAKLKNIESLLNKANGALQKNNSQRLTAQAEALTSQ
jgi:DNA repair exonuclease SbcCD ATPase subunit